jgi:DMSO/TMAO reductase YedYZ molybdopterin-dependent catalytic subunit
VIVHTANTIETQREAFGTSVITPDDILFVRNNLPPPDMSVLADRDAWSVSIEGVNNARSLTIGELKRLGIEAVASALQCSGNGRGFFGHKASGTQWQTGAAGCVIWSGVPVSVVATHLGGIQSGAQYITGTGGETVPPGIDPMRAIVERSVPIRTLAQAMLAWEMNGEPLSLAHGGPLRLVIPGYYGVNNVKYVKRLAFTPDESDAAIQRTGYRIRPIGEKGDPSQPSMWEMNVKSWIHHPTGTGERVPSGTVQIHGVALAGRQPVKTVEVSVDGGKTWKTAGFIGPDLGAYAWRQFVLPVRLDSGSYLIASRATDAAGNRQPEQRLENERGYGHNGWLDHAVRVTVA